MTKVDEAMAEAEQAHADDPERAELLRRARRFKASWIELAEALTEVKRAASWKRWGYSSLEEYAKNELHLRQETVDKLTGSFAFLQKRAPDVLRRDGFERPIPTYQAIDFLRRAESQEGAPEEAVQEIRRQVLEEGAHLPTIAKQFKDVVFPIDDAQRKQRDAAAIKNVAGRLKDLLADTRAVSKTMAKEVTSELERLLEAVSTKQEKAA
jgi:gas vesicle protein